MGAALMLCSCNEAEVTDPMIQGAYKTELVGRLPEEINESSGLVWLGDGTLLTHNDGQDHRLFRIDTLGKLVHTYMLPDFYLRDWEDLAWDGDSVLYIADIGNNTNTRHSVCVYKVSWPGLKYLGEIGIRYADQKAFPPPQTQMDYDAEALIYHENKLYLFSKNRGDAATRCYEIPTDTGMYTSAPMGAVEVHRSVTGGATNGSIYALLTYGKVYLFGSHALGHMPGLPGRSLNFSVGQCEGIALDEKGNFYISNEEGYLYVGKRKKK